MRIQENLEKSKYEADGKINIQGVSIPYHTICEDNFFVDEDSDKQTVHNGNGCCLRWSEYASVDTTKNNNRH